MVEFKSVSVVWPNHVSALSDVSLYIEKGEFAFLVGSTGAGKSTLLKLITREIQPKAGEVWVNGREVGRMRSFKVPSLRREMGIIPQDFGLLPNKRVGDNVLYALRVIGVGRKEARTKMFEALERVGLARKVKMYPSELSGGEQQRVAIARAIANHPSLLIADEPTGNLDPETSWEIMHILENINARGTTVVVATHDAPVVDRMKKRVVVLDHGSLMRDEQKSSYAYILR